MITLYTVGHSNHPAEAFLELLRGPGIKTLADVRSRPYSKWVPHFSKEPLSRSVFAAGIDYLFLGHVLGGRPDDPLFTTAKGRLDYALRARAPDFVSGIEKLIERAAERPTAILCAEEDPTRCHRRLLITPVLRQREVRVVHLRGDGSRQDEETLAPPDSQLSLFG